MIFEDIANVMNARPVKEIMRKTGLTKNRVYSLRMGCTFHMDYELLFALQRMGYEVRVFAVGDPARQSRDGDGKILVRGGEVMAAKRTTAQRGFAQRNGAERRQAPGCERGASRGTKERTPADPAGICGATFEQIENGVASTLPPAGATTGQPGFAAGEMRPNGNKGRVFAVGDPARQSRDGDGKILVRGDEVMAAKRTTAQRGFAQRNGA